MDFWPKKAKFGPKYAIWSFWAKYWHFWPIWSHAWPKNNANKVPRCFFSVMWVPKLLLSSVRIGICCPKTTIWPEIGIFGHFGQALQWCPDGELFGGCGARAASRKTPVYFIVTESIWQLFLTQRQPDCLYLATWDSSQGALGAWLQTNVVVVRFLRLLDPFQTSESCKGMLGNNFIMTQCCCMLTNQFKIGLKNRHNRLSIRNFPSGQKSNERNNIKTNIPWKAGKKQRKHA